MKTNIYLLLAIGVIIGAVFGFEYIVNTDKALAGVQVGSEYNYATTTSTQSGHKLVKSTTNTSVCTLGSVVIASSSASQFTIWNATSTTDVASSTITTFEANAAEGTYAFDVACTRGIVVAPATGFNGNVVTTYR